MGPRGRGAEGRGPTYGAEGREKQILIQKHVFIYFLNNQKLLK